MDFFECILNNLPDAICVIDTDTNKVKYVNDTFSNQLLSRHLIVGQSFETQILQLDFREAFLNSLKESKSSLNDVTIGLCKSLSCIGHEKCKCYNIFVQIFHFTYILQNILSPTL